MASQVRRIYLLSRRRLGITNLPGSALQTKLEKQGVRPFTQNGQVIIQHILRHQTDGRVTQAIWKREHSALQHQYLLLCVTIDHQRNISWVRVERLGDIAGSTGSASGMDVPPAGLCLTLAPSSSDLINRGNETIVNVNFDRYARLVDVAKLMSIVHDEASEYGLLHHNCWWFARLLVKILVDKYMSESTEKKEALNVCSFQTLSHAESTYHSPWRGRLLRGIALVVTLPIAPITVPIIVGASFAMAAATVGNLKKTERSAIAKFDAYLAEQTAA